MTDPSPGSPATETAVLGGGCFWCLDAVFRGLNGVISVESGYAGGAKPNPSYEEVCGGRTGHAEVVRVTFDPAQLSFRDLLTVFFTIHDPTTLNRQGNDVGTQYRSVVFCQSPAQRTIVDAVIKSLTEEKLFSGKIVTEVADAAPFLSGGDLSPGLLRTQRQPTVLHDGRCPEGRQIPQVVQRAPETTRMTRQDAIPRVW
jgi:peptide-methionine (S)-S-oxide reductase